MTRTETIAIAQAMLDASYPSTTRDGRFPNNTCLRRDFMARVNAAPAARNVLGIVEDEFYPEGRKPGMVWQ